MINGSYGGTKKPKVGSFVGYNDDSSQNAGGQTIYGGKYQARQAGGGYYRDMDGGLQYVAGAAKPKTTATTTTTPKPSTTYYTPPSGNKGVGQTGVTGGSTSYTAPQTSSYTAPTPSYTPPAASQQQASGSQLAQAITPAADPTAKPTRIAGESWSDYRGRIDSWKDANNMQEIGGRAISKDSNQWSDDDWQTVGRYRAAELGQAPGQHTNPYHVEQERQRLRKQVETKQQYDDLMKGNWSPDRQGEVDRLYNSGQINYDEYMRGAHDRVPDGQGDYQSQGNTIEGYRPDGTFGWYDKRDYPGWTSEMGVEMFAPRREDLNAATALGYDATHMGRDQAAEIAQQAAQMPQWGQPQQQQQMPQWGSAPQGTMAGNYGWGAGLGGPPQQQQMSQWGQPQQQMQMPQQSSQQQQWAMQPWGGQQAQQAMPQWGGAPQQQAMPQWGQMMQQQPMGGPMAGMEAARMGGGAMQQMGGGSPWASMWGDPFAGRQMTTDPNSPAMGGLPQMDPAQQLLMQMQGMGGGGLSGGFGAGGGSSGGGGMSGGGDGAYQTRQSGVGGAAQAGGGDPYGSLASILALFAGGGGGGGGGAGASYNPMYGGLPRNGLFYADLMGAGG